MLPCKVCMGRGNSNSGASGPGPNPSGRIAVGLLKAEGLWAQIREVETRAEGV